MKKTIIIIGVVLVTAITAFLLFTKPKENKVISQENFLADPQNISCIYLDDELTQEDEDAIQAYTPGIYKIEGITYDGSNIEEFVFNLMREKKIITYMHSYADVCLVYSGDSVDKYNLKYSVRQVYFTDSENVELYLFNVYIDKDTNEIEVQNLSHLPVLVD